MKQFGLIGYPLGHSLSPQIHRALFALDSFAASYTLFPIPPAVLQANLPTIAALNGFNVTIPYKQAIIPFLDALDETAALYSSVNTVTCTNGHLVGHNTDCTGFLQTLRTRKISLQATVCILGAGGVGRMFAIEAARQGACVTIAVRKASLQKGLSLAAELFEKTGVDAEIRPLETLSGCYELLINATPVGMFPHVNESPVPASFLDNISTVFDCIYNPAETLLLRDARLRKKQTVGGMDMLIWQAAAAQELWRGCTFDPADVREIIAREALAT